MKNIFLPFILLSVFSLKLNAQTHRNIEAKRTSQKVVLDGKLDDSAWKDAVEIKDFTEFRPIQGKKEDFQHRTETFLMYNDEGIYFGGTCFEATKDSIQTELIGRDNFGANDFVSINFDTYNDKLNGFMYMITPLNEQMDAKISSSDNNSEDFSWNAVWKSAAKIHDKGWDFEIFIPYAAIRFSKDKIQNWGINVTRRRQKMQQQFAWNPVDMNINGFLTQGGLLSNIQDIKPPIRLQLFPYLSFYQNHFPSNVAGQSNWSSQVAGGLDLKLGLNQAFTLDATLIPDFGQVQSDNKVLNLSPFEVQFNENRTFFTEGTELFSKGNLFYSRRIGGSPVNYGSAYENLKPTEKVIRNPSESKLINATKISGRNKKGLGVGILNAITKTQFATIKDNETGNVREVETDPATNYSIVVLDQNLKHNSSVSFINTSVIRGNENYNANVSKGLFSLTDKKNIYNFSGSVGLSKLNFKTVQDNSLGYTHNFGFSKNSGSFQFGLNQDLTDKKFTSNDLGYFTNNNYIDHSIYASYRIIKPKGWYNRIFVNTGSYLSHLYSKFDGISANRQSANVRINFNAQTKKLFWFGMFTNFNAKNNDFYEPRQEGFFFKKGASVAGGGWIETNDAKKYSVNLQVFHRRFINFYHLSGSDFGFNQSYRFNKKLSVQHSVSFDNRRRGLGYATTLNDNSIIFAVRKVNTTENILNLKYSFTNRMGLTFRTRHYMSKVNNKEYYMLNKNGLLTEKSGLDGLYNRNANFFNVDMVYTWQFAAGSFLNVVWKNNTFNSSDQANENYFNNFRGVLRDDQNNNISIKVIYFLDYLTVKRRL